MPDCNNNGIPDECDLLSGASDDCNQNSIPDECEGQMVVTVYNVTVNQPIPDANPTGVSSTFNVPDNRTIADLDLDIVIDHPWTGDLVVTISHGGVTQTIIDRPGFPSPDPDFGYADADAGINATLDDAAATSIESFTANGGTVTGTHAPAPGSLAAFNGMDAFGDWTMTVSDVEFDITGTFSSWALRVGETSAPVGNCTTGDCDGSGAVDMGDVDCLVNVLLGFDTDPSHIANADANGDGVLNGHDLQAFVNRLLP